MKNEVVLEVQKVEKIFSQVKFSNPEVYADWLAQTYYFVKHSTRLLCLSAGLCPFEYQFFHNRAISHAAEEKNHEKLVETDLKNLGYKLEQFPEHPATTAFYQCQYFSIQNENPLAFLGYVYLLEYLSISLGVRLHKEMLPLVGPKAVNFLKVHSEDDVEHIDSLEDLVKALKPEDQKAILANLKLSSFLYQEIMSQIGETAQVPHKKAA